MVLFHHPFPCAIDVAYHLQQVLAVLVFQHGLCVGFHLLACYPPLAVGDAFQTGDFQTLALLDDLDEDGGFCQGVVGACVQPCEAAAKGLHFQVSCL